MRQTFETKIAKLFSMSDEVWERHSNPWSVWTRFSVLPILNCAIWSRAWIGSWAWCPILLGLLWTWINPRLFSKPASTDNWASKAVLGERVWLNRMKVPVPMHHRMVPNLLSGVSVVALLPLVWGLWSLEIWPTLLGTIMIYAGKIWFLDRMVWLYEDTKNIPKISSAHVAPSPA